MESKVINTLINIEVCYGTAQKQHLESFLLPEGSTLKDAIIKAQPNLEKIFPEIKIDFDAAQPGQPTPFGVFSQPKPLNYVLKNHDRIEIYRPLLIDPMVKKQQRQANQSLRKIPR